jgi:hypothetical protein
MGEEAKPEKKKITPQQLLVGMVVLVVVLYAFKGTSEKKAAPQDARQTASAPAPTPPPKPVEKTPAERLDDAHRDLDKDNKPSWSFDLKSVDPTPTGLTIVAVVKDDSESPIAVRSLAEYLGDISLAVFKDTPQITVRIVKVKTVSDTFTPIAWSTLHEVSRPRSEWMNRTLLQMGLVTANPEAAYEYKDGVFAVTVEMTPTHEISEITISGHTAIVELAKYFFGDEPVEGMPKVNTVTVTEFATVDTVSGHTRRFKASEFKLTRARAKGVNWLSVRWKNVPRLIDYAWHAPGVAYTVD